MAASLGSREFAVYRSSLIGYGPNLARAVCDRSRSRFAATAETSTNLDEM